MRQELIIIFAILLIGAGALALENLSPDAVRVVAICFCIVLLLGFVGGYVARARRRSREDSADRTAAASDPSDEV